MHRPPTPHDILITNGANHALELITSLFLDRGDTIVMEEFSYPVMSESIALPKGYRALAVPMDDEGIIPSGLSRVLRDAWESSMLPGGAPRPKLLYTIPTGHNPTGCTTTYERRREVYELCRRFDVWIMEDDPYHYLQWRENNATGNAGGKGVGDDVHREALGLTGLLAGAGRVAISYLGMDVDQRVIRVDTFSKFLAPGVRLGWVTARADVIAKLTSALQAHTVGPCSLSQAVVAATLTTWGDAGLDAHLRRIQVEYARRCSVLAAAAERELRGLAEWKVPHAGMFLWIRLLGVEDSTDVWSDLRDAKVVVCPGNAMRCSATSEDFVVSPPAAAKSRVGGGGCPFVRVSFSSAADIDLENGMARLGEVLRRRQAST